MTEESRLLLDFVVIGAARSGTTSLYYYLRQHPEVYLPSVKELNHFSWNPQSPDPGMGPGKGPGDTKATFWTETMDAYMDHYRDCQPSQVAGEISTSYLYSPSAPERLARTLPGVRLFAIVRDPVERAWSQYLRMVRDGREELGFLEALDAEDKRVRSGWEFSWHYRRLGHYAEQLTRYLDCFPTDRIDVFLFEEFVADTRAVLARILERVGADPEVTLSLEPEHNHNRSGRVRSQLLARILNRPSSVKRLLRRVVPVEWGHQVMEGVRSLNLATDKPEMPDEARRLLREYYAEDLKRLEELLGRDLGRWWSDHG